MKLIKFHFSSGHVGSVRDEIVEFDDEASKEEINETFVIWLYEQSNANWFEVDESGNPVEE